MTISIEEVRSVQDEAVELISKIEPSASIGIGKVGDGFGLIVTLYEPTQSLIPSEVHGVPVRIRKMAMPSFQ